MCDESFIQIQKIEIYLADISSPELSDCIDLIGKLGTRLSIEPHWMLG